MGAFRGLSRALAVAGVVGLSCAGAQARDIVWARYGDIDTLDPHKATSTLSLQVWSLIYDTLLATDKDGNPVPNLAKSWTVNDAGTQYTLALNEGAVCHDGSPLDANDVKYTVDRAFDAASPSVTKASWGPITKAEVIVMRIREGDEAGAKALMRAHIDNSAAYLRVAIDRANQGKTQDG